MVLIKLGETFWTGFYIKYVMLIIYLLGDTSHKIPDIISQIKLTYFSLKATLDLEPYYQTMLKFNLTVLQVC
jgi:hypothetical protein